MRNKLSLCVLSLMLGTGLCWAGPPDTDAQAAKTIQSRLNHTQVQKHGDVQVTYEGGVATLTGTVDNLGSKLDVEKAAACNALLVAALLATLLSSCALAPASVPLR